MFPMVDENINFQRIFHAKNLEKSPKSGIFLKKTFSNAMTDNASAQAVVEIVNDYNISQRTLQGPDGQNILAAVEHVMEERDDALQRLHEKDKQNHELRTRCHATEQRHDIDRENMTKVLTIVTMGMEDSRKRMRPMDDTINMDVVAKVGDLVTDLKGTRSPNPCAPLQNCRVYKIVIEDTIKYYIRHPDGSNRGERGPHNIRREA